MACDIDVPTSSLIEFATMRSSPKETVEVAPPENHIKSAINDIIPSHEGEKLVLEEDGNEKGDLEATYRSVSQPYLTVMYFQ